jgi:hypothetical protein
MSKTLWAAILCAAGLAAGCGSSAKTHTPRRGRAHTGVAAKPSGPPMATVGPAGAIERASSAGYRATSGAVLFGIRVALVRFFTSKGFSGVTVHCESVNAGVASCDVAGMTRSNQNSSSAITLSVDQTSGALRITRVGS